MNERPTPETERVKGALHTNWDDLLNHARRLECERDEAREALADWENAADHVEANHPDEVHCSCVPVLRKLLADARKERDEAIADRDIARLSALESDRAHDRMVAELEKVYKERDDALSQIVQAECRAERFCQERDEAWACCDELVVDSNAITLAKTVMRLERERDEARDQSRWKSTKVALPTAGEWVLHTYKGVRAPEYGIYERGHFFRGGGPESFPATHWLSVPNISCVKCGETLRGDEDESEAHCKWCVQGWESTTSDPTEAAK